MAYLNLPSTDVPEILLRMINGLIFGTCFASIRRISTVTSHWIVFCAVLTVAQTTVVG